MEPQEKRLFNVDELTWFCRNAYNLGIKNHSSWDLRHVVRVLAASVKIIEKFPSDSNSGNGDLALRYLFCTFIIAAALNALARAEDKRAEQLEYYRLMQERISQFDDKLGSSLDLLSDVIGKDLQNKLAILLVFDLEGAVCLEQWSSLSEIVRRAAICKTPATYEAMGDCILRSHIPAEGKFPPTLPFLEQALLKARLSVDKAMFSTMRLIINELWELEGFGAAKLAKFQRCLFQVTLARDANLAFPLLEEACKTAEEARDVSFIHVSL